KITWSGKFRPDLNNMKIFPRPIDDTLPIWRAVGGPPASAITAGRQGIPMMITTLGGPSMTCKDCIEQYRLTAEEDGFDDSSESLQVAAASPFYTADRTREAFR